MKELTCAFSGHRPSHFRFGYDETDLDCMRLKITLRREILRMIDFGTTQFFSGMALGWICGRQK
jgi:DNA primase catalytic subunit